MTSIVLGILLAIEAIFSVYCITTRSNQTKIKSYVRIATFIVFVTATLVSIVKWRYVWYGLVLVLFVRAIIGIYKLVCGEKVEKGYRLNRIISKTVVSFAVIILMSSPAILFPQIQPLKTTGEYEVATAIYTYTDNSRIENYTDGGENRKVTAEFWYPKNGEETYPLVVFTHGLYGISASNAFTFAELASNGYVVCSVSHPYISVYTKEADGNVVIISSKYMETASVINSGTDDEQLIYNTFKELAEMKATDMNFIINEILINVTMNNDGVYSLIDKNKVGIFGHSMGGATVSTLVRERGDIAAVINLDGPLIGELLGMKNGSAVLRDDPYPIPLLNVYSDNLWGLMDEDPIYAANTKILTNTPANIYNINFRGSKHMNFTDLAIYSPILANALQGSKGEIDAYDCLETMNDVVLNFFNCYLKGDNNLELQSEY